MSGFEEANERLLSALDRLERIAEQRQSGAAAAEGKVDGNEVEALREQLDNSRRANAALRSSRDEVASRLDGAIERLTSVLGD